MSDCSYKAMVFEQCSKTPDFLQCHNCATRAGIARASTPTSETHVYRGSAPKLSATQGHISKLEREELDSAGVPRSVLMGTPSDECSLYLDDHINAEMYAIGFDPAYGNTVTVVRIPSPPKAPAASCSGCAGLVFFTENDCLQHHSSRDRTPCAWSCRQRATVEHEQRRIASPLKPPTLREWLGDRVGELGRWDEVLRDHPVPHGWVNSWRFDERQTWSANGGVGYAVEMIIHLAHGFALGAKHDALFVCFFTSHPDVKPEPPPKLRTRLGNEDT